MVAPTPPRTPPSHPGAHDQRLAWVSVAVLPVAFVLAMVAGEGLISQLGYEPGSEGIPVGVALLAGIPALLIIVIPGVAAVHFGVRAYRSGLTSAQLPAWIGGSIAAFTLATNLASFALRFG